VTETAVLAAEDRVARIVETWDRWREDPFQFGVHTAFVEVMAPFIEGLRRELARAGWEAARS